MIFFCDSTDFLRGQHSYFISLQVIGFREKKRRILELSSMLIIFVVIIFV